MEQQQKQQQEEQKVQDDIQNNPMIQSLLKKNEGNKHFAHKKYKEALECYIISLENLSKQDLKDQTDQQKESFLAQEGIIKNNMAAAYVELYQYKNAIQICDEILKDFPNSIKALFRRGVAYLQLDQLEKANEDFKAALTLNPGNPEILKVLDVANRRLQDPVHLTRIIMNGGFKFDMKDPYIYDPQRETREKFQEPNEKDKNFQLQGCRDFDLKKAKVHREKLPRSIDMLHKSVCEDSWAYIDKQVTEDFGFSKLEQDQWHLLLGIYQVLMIYQNINKEIIEKARQDNKLHELFSQKFDQLGWFKYENRQLQCLYYKYYLQENLNITD